MATLWSGKTMVTVLHEQTSGIFLPQKQGAFAFPSDCKIKINIALQWKAAARERRNWLLHLPKHSTIWIRYALHQKDHHQQKNFM